MTDPATFTVFAVAMLTAIATGLGAIPLLFARQVSPRLLSLSNAAAAGLMLAACHALVAEGIELGTGRLLAGVAAGLAGIIIAHRYVSESTYELGSLKGLDARKALLIVGVMTAHSFAEGVGVGVAFGGDGAFATFISTAIAIHNIPEGLAIALVLVPRGTPVWQAALWAIFSSLPQPLMAVPSYWFVEAFREFLPIGLGFAAGAMFWLVFAELIPDANKHEKPENVGVAITLAFAAMIAFQYVVLK